MGFASTPINSINSIYQSANRAVTRFRSGVVHSLSAPVGYNELLEQSDNRLTKRMVVSETSQSLSQSFNVSHVPSIKVVIDETVAMNNSVQLQSISQSSDQSTTQSGSESVDEEWLFISDLEEERSGHQADLQDEDLSIDQSRVEDLLDRHNASFNRSFVQSIDHPIELGYYGNDLDDMEARMIRIASESIDGPDEDDSCWLDPCVLLPSFLMDETFDSDHSIDLSIDQFGSRSVSTVRSRSDSIKSPLLPRSDSFKMTDEDRLACCISSSSIALLPSWSCNQTIKQTSGVLLPEVNKQVLTVSNELGRSTSSDCSFDDNDGSDTPIQSIDQSIDLLSIFIDHCAATDSDTSLPNTPINQSNRRLHVDVGSPVSSSHLIAPASSPMVATQDENELSQHHQRDDSQTISQPHDQQASQSSDRSSNHETDTSSMSVVASYADIPSHWAQHIGLSNPYQSGPHRKTLGLGAFRSHSHPMFNC